MGYYSAERLQILLRHSRKAIKRKENKKCIKELEGKSIFLSISKDQRKKNIYRTRIGKYSVLYKVDEKKKRAIVLNLQSLLAL